MTAIRATANERTQADHADLPELPTLPDIRGGMEWAMHEGETIQAIRAAIGRKALNQPFSAADVNSTLRIMFAGTFLPKHCDQRPDLKMTWLFDRTGRGRYRLNAAQQALCDAGS